MATDKSKANKSVGTNPKAPNTKQMLEFIRMFHDTTAEKPWFQTYVKGSNGGKAESFKAAVNPTLRDRLVAANKDGMNVSMAINRIEGDQRIAKNVNAINAVFIDCDDAVPSLNDLRSLPLPPNMVVATSSGRHHAYWLVHDCTVEQFSEVQLALARHFGTDTNIKDATRVMRLPGTLNWKYSKPFLARIVHRTKRKPISVAKLLKQLDISVEISRSDSSGGSEVVTATPTIFQSLQSGVTAPEIEAALDRIDPDDRATWLRVGMAIHSVMPEQDGYQLWTRWSNSSSKFNEKDQKRTWDNFKPGGIGIRTLLWLAGEGSVVTGWDNFSLGRLFADTFCDQLRYDEETDCWYSFNGVVWKTSKKAPMKLAQKLIDDLWAGEGRKQEGLKAYRSPSGLSTILKMAEIDEQTAVSEKMFDRNQNLLAVNNGVVDLPTGHFRVARADEFLRRQADVDYDPKAKSNLWLKFIDQVTCGDHELAFFLQVAVGYTLFGHAKAQVFFVLEGSGGNGKGVFLRTLTALLGQYANELAPNIVTSAYAANANAPAAALMMLKGLRLAIVTELPNKRGFDTAFVKQFAGGDSITARPLHGEMLTFKPEGKLWISTNEMPEIAATDHAMWRRVVPIPFAGKFAYKKSRDKDLEDKLLLERSGILNWALEGARKYAELGTIPDCNAVAVHKKRMRRDADVFASWFKECCKEDAAAKVQSSAAYASYASYAKKIGRSAMGMPAFKNRMAKEGYQHKETKKFNAYTGFELKDLRQ